MINRELNQRKGLVWRIDESVLGQLLAGFREFIPWDSVVRVLQVGNRFEGRAIGLFLEQCVIGQCVVDVGPHRS